jgi:hypothetical protein
MFGEMKPTSESPGSQRTDEILTGVFRIAIADLIHRPGVRIRLVRRRIKENHSVAAGIAKVRNAGSGTDNDPAPEPLAARPFRQTMKSAVSTTPSPFPSAGKYPLVFPNCDLHNA